MIAEFITREHYEVDYLEVVCHPRYWEDATVNGVTDEDGTLIPGRSVGNRWRIYIDLDAGQITDWPIGTTAEIHYKVCDDGYYYLTDHAFNRIAQWATYYVPDAFLCHGDNGYGDYIILNIDENGFILNWTQPYIDLDEWKLV